jgi:hypothetical protein
MPKKPKSLTWTVNGNHIEETVHGTIFDALTTATQIALLESEWPQKGNVISSATIIHSNGTRFILSLHTPDRPEKV